MRQRVLHLGIAGCALVAIIAAAPIAAGAPPELKMLHALLVIDTNSSLKDSIVVDKARMEALLVNAIPRNRYQLTTFTGSSVTRTNILNYFHHLQGSASDAVLFYYAGHGGIDPDRGHFLFLQEGKTAPLIRSDLRRALADTRAGLTVILTDCCSNHLKIPRHRSLPHVLVPARQIHPVLRGLLFQSRGMVDITAASDNSAWGDEEEGGIFTRSVARLLLDDARPDGDGGGALAWKEFFVRLDRETQKTFAAWARQAKARGDVVDQASQRPHAFELPGGAARSQETSYAVVGLRNDTPATVHYQYRWSTAESWQNSVLGPRSTAPRFVQLPPQSDSLPMLEFRLGNAEKGARLTAKRWTGVGQPSYDAGRKYKVASKSKKLRHLDLQDSDEVQSGSSENTPAKHDAETPPDEVKKTSMPPTSNEPPKPDAPAP